MALAAVSANLDIVVSTPQGQDCAGIILLTWFRKLIATGLWEQFGAGDGVLNFTTGTTDIFTDNTNGWKTSGTWNTPTANSVSNPLAWMCIREIGPGNTPTGRMWGFQRGSGSALGNDRFNIVVFSRTGFSGVPSATSFFPTGTYRSVWEAGSANTLGGAGTNIFSNLTGQPYLGGAGGTNFSYSIWIPDALSAGNVAAHMLTWHSSAGTGGAFFYEALKCPSADTSPYLVAGDAYSSLFGGTNISGNPNTFAATGQATFSYNGAGTLTLASFSKVTTPDNTPRPPNTTAIQASANSAFPIFPLDVWLDTATSSTFKGSCESLEFLYPGSVSYMSKALFHTGVADPNEKPRISFGVITAPWLVGKSVTDSPGNRTDVYTVHPTVAADVAAPVISAPSPAAGAISATQALSISATDPGGSIARVFIKIEYSAPDRTDAAFDGKDDASGYDSDYNASSTVTPIADGYTYAVVPDAGWRGAFTLRVTAIDSGGNVTTASHAYTMSASNQPTLTNISPAAPATIAYTSGVQFDVSDQTSLLTEIIHVLYPSGVRECIWNGSAFSSAFSALSARNTLIAGKSFQYQIQRSLGWPAHPTIEVKAIDGDGQVVNTSLVYTLNSTNIPRIAGVTPVSGSSIAYNDSIAFNILDDVGIAELVVRVQYPAPVNRTEVIYAGSALQAPYNALSTLNNPTNTVYEFVLDDGWKGNPTILISAVDLDGNEFHTSINYTVTGFNPLAPDTTDPVISLVSPASLSAIATGDAVSFRVVDTNALAFFAVTTDYVNTDRHEVAYLNGFDSRYDAGSSLTPVSGGYDVVIDRDLGWADDFSLHIYAIDTSGNDVSLSISYTLTESHVPTVSNVVPTNGTDIPQGGSIYFRARDASKLSHVMVLAKFPSIGRYEVVWDDSAFGPQYDAGSSVTPSAPLFSDFVVTREDGWPAPVTLKIFAFDEDDNLTAQELTYGIATTLEAEEASEAHGSSWGLGEWGLSGWGSGPGGQLPLLLGTVGDVANTEGGTVVALMGTNFANPMTVELLQGGQVVGTAVIANPDIDLSSSRVYVGLPALAAGFYDVRVTTAGGSALLTNAIEYRPFAAEFKTESVRRKWGRKWNLSTRIL